MSRIVTIFFAFCFLLQNVCYAAAFAENDLGRILYLKNTHSNSRNRFVILDRISNRGRSLSCHYLGSTRQLKLMATQVSKLPFYENSSNFRITQYAFYNIINNVKPNLALILARANGDNTGRVRAFNNFSTEAKNFLKSIKEVFYNQEFEPEEKTDKLLDLIDNCPLGNVIKDAISSQDWLLAIILHDQMLGFFRNPSVAQCSSPEVLKRINSYIADAEKNLLTEFAKQMQQENVRRKEFQNLFPNARGLWSVMLPSNFREMRKLAAESIDSYIKLDRLSRITAPQDWGTAMLNALLLTEGTPGADELEKEFDNAMIRISRQRQHAAPQL